MENLATTLRIGAGHLPPVVDVEDNPAFDGAWNSADNPAYLEMLRNWTDTMQQRVGTPPIIYTRAGFWEQLGNPTGFDANPLWVASYRSGQPRLPAGRTGFAFWQYSDSGTVDGLSGHPADLSYFHSADPAELRALTLK